MAADEFEDTSYVPKDVQCKVVETVKDIILAEKSNVRPVVDPERIKNLTAAFLDSLRNHTWGRVTI